MKRREFIKSAAVALGGIITSGCISNSAKNIKCHSMNRSPNVILCMCDDLGWGDVGYHGTNSEIKTPNIDKMATNSLQFGRFYAGAPVCSPTRGSAITGRHPYRYGIVDANKGHMKTQEVTLAEALKTQGYTTGHYGKWHLGTLTTEIKDANRGKPGNIIDYSPPWDNGFDKCFSTESKVPTYDPMYSIGSTTEFYGTRYWKEDGTFVPQNAQELKGDDSRVIMDQAIPFIQSAVKQQTPFLAVIWFHTPHLPFVAGAKYKAMYSNLSEDKQAYYGCITAMDEQMRRLRKELQQLGIAENTLLWFTSDNGPEKGTPGTTGGFRGRKRSLYEGGVRVPGLLEWPAQIKSHRATQVPCSTSDYFPTVMDILGFRLTGVPEPIDGISLIPLIKGQMDSRPVPIGFQFQSQQSLTDNRYKLYSDDKGKTYELYDLTNDPYETSDIAAAHPDVVTSMKKTLDEWIESCQQSSNGNDYKKG